MTASRCTDAVSYERTSQRGEWRGQPATATPTTSPATGAWRGRPTIPRSMPSRSACSGRCWRPCSSPQGTPMLLAGDEFGRTQGGNNNAYCQDNEISWLDWSMAAIASRELRCTAYVARLIALRREHPVLRQPHFLHGRSHPAPGIADIAWFDQSGGDNFSRGLERSRAADIGACAAPMRIPEGKVTILTLAAESDGDRPCDFRLPDAHLPGSLLLDSAAAGADERTVAGRIVRSGPMRGAVLLRRAGWMSTSFLRMPPASAPDLLAGRADALSPLGAGTGSRQCGDRGRTDRCRWHARRTAGSKRPRDVGPARVTAIAWLMECWCPIPRRARRRTTCMMQAS